jgi:hypothetical protein
MAWGLNGQTQNKKLENFTMILTFCEFILYILWTVHRDVHICEKDKEDAHFFLTV